MLVFETQSADEAWRALADRLHADGSVQEGRDQPTRELLHVGFSLLDARQRLVFARPVNPAFAVAEVVWMLAGFNDVAWLSWWNPRVKKLAADPGKGAFHGAYGYRLGSRPHLHGDVSTRLRHVRGEASVPLDQLRTAAEALDYDPTSRQIVLQIWDAVRDLPIPMPQSRDIPCNLVSHLLIRDGSLQWLQVMRSNDLVWGLPYNIVQFTTLQEIMAGWLGVEVGQYTHLSSSLHVYQRHWGQLAALETGATSIPFNCSDLRVGPYSEWEKVWSRLVVCTDKLMGADSRDELLGMPDQHRDLPKAYQEWVALLTAESLRKIGDIDAALGVIEAAGPFWGRSWQQWAAAQSRG